MPGVDRQLRERSVRSEPATFDLLEHTRRDRPATADLDVLEVPLDALVQGRSASQAVLLVPLPIERRSVQVHASSDCSRRHLPSR